MNDEWVVGPLLSAKSGIEKKIMVQILNTNKIELQAKNRHIIRLG